MLLMLDNYDSFTYNLVQYLQALGAEVMVVRNDAMRVDQIAALRPERIVISPGPCTPNEAGISLQLIEQLGQTTPILGVCLGHQSIGQVYGGDVIRAGNIMHGKTSPIRHEGKGVFAGLPDSYEATRYHSLVVDKTTLAGCAGGHRLDRKSGWFDGRDHGPSPSPVSGRRRAVPSRIDPDPARARLAEKLSAALIAMRHLRLGVATASR